MSELLERAKQFLLKRRNAYRMIFRGPYADTVLADLAKFCRAQESTFEPDARVSAGYDGRREVWLRIQEHLHLSPERLMELYHTVGE
jgi:hypothetical protein